MCIVETFNSINDLLNMYRKFKIYYIYLLYFIVNINVNFVIKFNLIAFLEI